MTFDRAFMYFNKGKSIRRKNWANTYFYVKNISDKITITVGDIKADDWEVLGMGLYEVIKEVFTVGSSICHY